MVELDRLALASAHYAFMHSPERANAGRVEDAVVAYLHAVDYAARQRDYATGLTMYPSGADTAAAVAAHRAPTACRECVRMARQYGARLCDACWQLENPGGLRVTMTVTDANPDAVRAFFGMDPSEEGQQ